MKRTFQYGFLLFLILMIGIPLNGQQKVSLALQKEIKKNTTGSFIQINIILEESYDKEKLNQQLLKSVGKEERRRILVDELSTFSKASQSDVLNQLKEMERENLVNDVRTLWITNLINCKAKPEAIMLLNLRDDIKIIDLDNKIEIEKPVENNKKESLISKGEKNYWGYQVINTKAYLAWDAGYTGEGVLVALIDGGIDFEHVDLSGSGWEDPNYPNHGWNTLYNNYDTDDNASEGHGTHCAGIVAGDGTAGIYTGLAPDATLMAIKVYDDILGGTENSVWAGLEFAVEHGAQIISMSLGMPANNWPPPSRDLWREVMDNVLAAGLIAAVSAGNNGFNYNGNLPPPINVNTPGDCPPPWRHPDQTLIGDLSSVVSIGSTDPANEISYFSSLGPASWEDIAPYNDYPYNPEMGLIRPDLVAPGSGVFSCKYNTTSEYWDKSGTSMAAPAVAGVMALILQKNPNYTPAQICQVIQETAVSPFDHKTNTFGAGLVNAYEALMQTSFPGVVYVSHSINDAAGNSNGQINQGELISLNFTLRNDDDDTIVNPIAILRTKSPYITLIDSITQLSDFLPGEIKDFSGVFSFITNTNIPGNHQIDFSIHSFPQQSTDIEAKSYFNDIAFAPNLQCKELIIDDQQYGNGNNMLDPGETATLKFTVKNTGQILSENIMLDLSADFPLIQLLQHEFSTTALSSNDSVIAGFDVFVHESTLPGALAVFTIQIQSGPYDNLFNFNATIGNTVEDWETGNFGKFNWTFGGNAPWEISADEPFEGVYSARSGVITHNQSSELNLEYNVLHDDSISFYYRVSSQTNKDKFKFLIDNQELENASGPITWVKKTYPVTAGQHTFRWVYTKDGSGSVGQDLVRIDSIVLPIETGTIVFAGFDAEVCDNYYETRGYASNYTSLAWSTDGDGFFVNPTEINSRYIFGNFDRMNGFVNHFLEIQNSTVTILKDTVHLILLPAPVVNLGADTSVCADEAVLLDAGQGYASYLWSDGSQGQTLLVTWEEFGNNPEIFVIVANEFDCQSADTINITFNPLPEVNLGPDISVCSDETVLLDAGPDYSSYLWSDGSQGQTLFVTDELFGNNPEIFVIVTNEFDCQATDTINITFNPLPEVYLGPDVSICSDETVLLDAGPSYSSYLWSDGSQGQTLLVSNELFGNNPKIFVIVTNEFDCQATDTINITFNPLPEVYLGPDTVLCINQLLILDAGPGYAAYLWSDGSQEQTLTVTFEDFGLNPTVFVDVWNDFDCLASDTINILFDPCLSIKETETDINAPRIFPNPANDKLNIEISDHWEPDASLSIYNNKGKLVKSIQKLTFKGEQVIEVDISDLANEIYIILIKYNGNRKALRFIKQG